MKTYIVENKKTGEVFNYSETLYNAKEYLRLTGYDERLCILMLEGSEFGEGFHKYRLYFSGTKNGKDIFVRKK